MHSALLKPASLSHTISCSTEHSRSSFLRSSQRSYSFCNQVKLVLNVHGRAACEGRDCLQYIRFYIRCTTWTFFKGIFFFFIPTFFSPCKQSYKCKDTPMHKKFYLQSLWLYHRYKRQKAGFWLRRRFPERRYQPAELKCLRRKQKLKLCRR